MNSTARAIMLAAVAGACAVASVLPAAAAPLPAVGTPDDTAAAERRPVSVVELDLAAPAASAPSQRLGARSLATTSAAVDSGQRDTAPFTVLGVSWAAGPTDVTVQYRTRSVGADDWTAWQDADAGEGGSSGQRVNTDALVTEPSDGVQVVVASASAAPVEAVKVVLVDPGSDPAADPAAVSEPAVAYAAPTVPRPAVVTRAQWGADESLRTCAPDYSTSMVSAAVHHTDSVNTYSPDEAAGIVRGIYAYHTRPEAAGGRGWCDIGYNALVDRFGRIYEGRVGSFDESVVGVHTGGFNSRTFGISVIGNFVSTAPSPEILEGLSQAIAWKFATQRILAGSSVTMVSGGGASKYPEGTVVTFPTIYGHRDAQLTSCPGQELYDRLPQVRARVAELANAAVGVSPASNWEQTRADTSGITVSGWTFDPESTASLVVDVQVDHVSHGFLANGSRPDVGAAYPGAGSAHGFTARVPTGAGSHLVCLWVQNVGAGNDQLLGCRQVTVTNHAPVGFVDQVTATASTVRVSGWALDVDTTASIPVHVYADGVFLGAVTADATRPDVGSAYPGLGSAHGFTAELPVGAGTHQVCVFAINSPTGQNPSIGCRTVTVVNAAPVGFVDQAVGTATSIRLSGWALDADTTAPLAVHVYVDGGYAGQTTADGDRPDVGAAYPKLGAAHGFTVEVPAAGGTHQVCAYAINAPTGYNPPLGCRTVTVVNADPKGFVDRVAGGTGSLVVEGWALDPDTSAPITVHVYVNGVPTQAVTANGSRPDIATAFPGSGSLHGFSATVPAAKGRATVCVYAINTPVGGNPALGCRDTTVS